MTTPKFTNSQRPTASLFSKILLLAAFALLAISSPAFAAQPKTSSPNAYSYDLIISHVSNTSVQLNWTGWGENGNPYMVTMRNMDTNQVEGTFQTSGTSLNIQNLKPGKSYIFTVTKNDYIIVDQTEM